MLDTRYLADADSSVEDLPRERQQRAPPLQDPEPINHMPIRNPPSATSFGDSRQAEDDTEEFSLLITLIRDSKPFVEVVWIL